MAWVRAIWYDAYLSVKTKMDIFKVIKYLRGTEGIWYGCSESWNSGDTILILPRPFFGFRER